MSWQFGHLRMFAHDLIVADPPWDFENYSEAGTKKGADPHYKVMPLSEIKALRVHELASDSCLLLMWCTGWLMARGEAAEVTRAWGFEPKSEIIWEKTFASGKARMGTGYRVRTMHEPILLATIGNPRHKAFPSRFAGIAREHSRKPEEFYDLVDQSCPDLKGRADLFSRTDRKGWAAWGHEAGKFGEAA